jgi:phosphoribosylformylglycinamidine (FGAM) synthase PurS component
MADCPVMISIISYSWATSHDLWETQLEENRQKYADMKEELLLNPVIYFWFVQFSHEL